MSTQPKAGEMLVGAYLKHVEDCEIVAYGQHSPNTGEQMELDVIGFQPEGDQEIIACEVATHIRGLNYGNADENRDKVVSKFRNAEKYIDDVFGTSHPRSYQFWSPIVRGGSATKLESLESELSEKLGHEVEMVINEDYTARIRELKSAAASSTGQQNELAFRVLQILGHMR
ncbi:hypothetical protein [Halobaculum sp. D14]|uniref:hypothetical protein n=1 Tax=Halobaculum sp. D14 TaxID=3421642 RepID=UPI003EBF30B9